MSEDATVILIMLLMATFAYLLYQRLFVIRGLRKKLDRYVDAALAGQPATAAVRPVPAELEHSEFRKIQDRLRVLERIAVEKEDTLSREIEELRAVGR